MVGGLSLHSGYDPSREAARFLESCALDSRRVDAVLVVGPGLGYLLRSMRVSFPHLRLLSLFVSSWCYEHAVERGDAAWHPAAGEPVARFLQRELGSTAIERSSVMTWPPVRRAWPSDADALEQAVLELLRERQATAVTEGYFGTRWLRNMVCNLRRLPPFERLPRCSGTVVIAASGPSLEKAAEAIASVQSRVRLWALPSAVAPLHAAGLAPDMVVLTDPGFYAIRHLATPRLRPETPVAMPLTAARGAWSVSDRVVPLQQQLPFEEVAFGAGGINGTSVAESGTVAGTALELALQAGFERVVFAGLDLCSADLTVHSRPDLLSHYRGHSSRLRPMLTARFLELYGSEAVAARAYAPRSLATYAAWFRRRAGELGGRLLRLMPSPVELGIAEVTAAELATLPSGFANREAPNEAAGAESADQTARDRAAAAIVEAVADSAERALTNARKREPLRERERWLLRAIHLPSALTLERAEREQERREQLSALERSTARFLSRLHSYVESTT